MAIDITKEGLLHLRKVPAHLETLGGRRHHLGTVYRWAFKGVVADDGTTIQLETVRVGKAHYTSAAAVARFAARLSYRPLAKGAPRPSRAGKRVYARPNSADAARAAREQRTREILKRHRLDFSS